MVTGRERDAFVDALGAVVVVAPHPDDESIGCGGLIALLRERGSPVSVLLMSDGAMSHPNSRRFTPDARRAIRSAEMADALTLLGVDAARLHAMGWADGALPARGQAAFASAVRSTSERLRSDPAQTMLVPWRRDPHPDHRAANQIALAAVALLERPMRVLEYPVWTAERGTPDDLPAGGEARTWTLDISTTVARKLQAVAAHRSQCGAVIDDDPGGFTLSAGMLACCAEPVETYYEAQMTMLEAAAA